MSGTLYTATATVNERFADGTEGLREMSFCSFDCDFSEPLTVSITPAVPRKTAVLRPQVSALFYTFDGKTLTVVLEKPMKLSVEFDGDMYRNLFLYGNEISDMPAAGEKVLCLTEPVYHLDTVKLSDGEWLYIGGNTVVY